MPRRKTYPDHIDRKYSEAPNIRNTEKQQNAASILERNWDANEDAGEDRATFSELAENNSLSRNTFQKAWKHYFGPTDDKRTFYEIEEEYGSTDAYYQQKQDEGEDELEEIVDGPLTEELVKAFQQGYAQGRRDERQKHLRAESRQ